MRNIVLALSAAAMVAPIAITPVDAQTSRRTAHQYRHVSYNCRRGHGTTGLLVGGAGGALIGSAVTHGAAGPIIGGVGGALLGRHIQRHRRCRY